MSSTPVANIWSFCPSIGFSSKDSSIFDSLIPSVRVLSMCLAILSSSSTRISSLIIQMISKREARGGGRPVSL